ncbi:MAG: FtsW/RodA/SpoVE family cell cycle protein [Clostridium sp.]|uniref:FtsW/RodA/SpoVE family cell cycle protein n=1 Tax=Clostridium sp. TaxID=1506 RepID=UPI003F3AF21F
MRLEDNDLVINYLDNICSNIKNKRMHEEIKEELLCHIEESFLINLKVYKNEDAAIKKAIKNMGDYKKVSEDLNIIHKPTIDWSLLSAVFLLLTIGLVSLYYISTDLFITNFQRSIVFSVIGIGAMLFASTFNYIKLKVYSKYIYGFTVLITMYSYFFSNINSVVKSFLIIGPISINLSEITPILFLIAFCDLIKKFSSYNDKFDFLKLFILIFIPFILLASLNNFFSVCIYLIGTFSLLIIKGFKKRYIIIPLLILVGLFLFSLDSYKLTRFTSFLNPNADPLGSGYMYVQIKAALENSVLIGTANNFNPALVPEMFSDFIFIFIIYKFGYLAGIFTMLLSGFLLFKISKTLIRTKNNYNKSLILIPLVIFATKFIFGILMNLGLLPVVGVSIPLLSYSGTSSVINFILIGLILNIYKVRNLSNIETLTICKDKNLSS